MTPSSTRSLELYVAPAGKHLPNFQNADQLMTRPMTLSIIRKMIIEDC